MLCGLAAGWRRRTLRTALQSISPHWIMAFLTDSVTDDRDLIQTATYLLVTAYPGQIASRLKGLLNDLCGYYHGTICHPLFLKTVLLLATVVKHSLWGFHCDASHSWSLNEVYTEKLAIVVPATPSRNLCRKWSKCWLCKVQFISTEFLFSVISMHAHLSHYLCQEENRMISSCDLYLWRFPSLCLTKSPLHHFSFGLGRLKRFSLQILCCFPMWGLGSSILLPASYSCFSYSRK